MQDSTNVSKQSTRNECFTAHGMRTGERVTAPGSHAARQSVLGTSAPRTRRVHNVLNLILEVVAQDSLGMLLESFFEDVSKAVPLDYGARDAPTNRHVLALRTADAVMYWRSVSGVAAHRSKLPSSRHNV